MSWTLSTNSGSGDNLKLSTRCGFNPNARQIRLIAVWLMPVASAIDLVDQCVAFAGLVSSVFTITRSTSSSLIVRGFPGLGSSCRPSRRRSENLVRHFRTVSSLTPSRRPTSTLLPGSEHASTIRHRNASA